MSEEQLDSFHLKRNINVRTTCLKDLLREWELPLYLHSNYFLLITVFPAYLHAQIDQNKFDEWWPNEMRILATAGPAERLKFVNRIMQTRSTSNGEVVAVTASGVNDDKVLRTADVGLTMVTITAYRLF